MIRILIAEDDPLMLDALATCVESEGFEVLRAADGRAALELWRNQKPDLLCLDIMMPEMDGYQLCKRVRESDASIPILFISAKNEERDVVAGLDLGADDFVRKPFTRGEVMARIRAALRKRAPESLDESFSLGDLQVFPRSLEARRDDKKMDLTPRETSMLRLLHDNKGKAVSRDAFLDTCWGVDYYPDSRTLDQHISVLRKKVEIDSSNPEIIRTARGVGYRWG
ncbi:MAG: response regulator transcription factor [Akkermansiaceae bacterium]|nr:response regulator transcription factor [Akkermansiaceae bacterium]